MADAIIQARITEDVLQVDLAEQTLAVRMGDVVAHQTLPDGTPVDHGLQAGLEDDDHPQYLTTGRGDARYDNLGRAATERQDHEHDYNHGLLHEQGTDEELARGTANEVTAATLRGHVDNAAKHRTINDGAETTTNLWSGAKIAGELANKANVGAAGTGDMTKAIYDPDGDGVVTQAALANSCPWAGVTGAPAEYPPEAHTHAPAAVGLPDPAGAPDGKIITTVGGAYGLGDAPEGGGVTDHGALTGLADDDHAQYHTDARGDARYYPRAEADAAFDAAGAAAVEITDHESEADPHPNYRLESESYSDAETDAAIDADIAAHAADPDAHHAHANKSQLDLVTDGDHDVRVDNPHGVTAVQSGADPAGTAASAVAAHEATYDHDLIGAGGGGVTDHGALTGLADDDHTQYHTDARGDARYEPLGTTAAHEAASPAHAAANVSYNNGVTGIASATAQGAIDITYNLALATYLNQIGMVRRPTFQRTGSTQITLAGGFVYDVQGNIVATTADIAFTVTGLSASTAEWHYLYIKTGTTGTPTAADLINSTTPPGWSAGYRGWYDASGNRCIFAFFNAGNGVIFDFTDGGRGLIYFETERATNVAGTNVGTSWVTVQLLLPVFAQEASVFLYAYGSGTTKTYYWRRNGSTGNGSYLIQQVSGAVETLRMFVQSDAQGRGQISSNVTGANLVSVFQVGYTLPAKGI